MNVNFIIKKYSNRFWLGISVFVLIGCSDPWKEEGSLPQINLFLEALKDEVADPEILLSANAKIFIQSTFVLFVYEKSIDDPYIPDFDYRPLCREYLASGHPIALSTTVVALDANERNAQRRIYGYIPAVSWYIPETGAPIIGTLPGKDLLLCSTSQMPYVDQATVFGTPTWLSQQFPNFQPLFLDLL